MYASYVHSNSHDHHIGSYGKFMNSPKYINIHLGKSHRHQEAFKTRALLEHLKQQPSAAPPASQPDTTAIAQPSVIASAPSGGDDPGRSDDRDRDGGEQREHTTAPATLAIVAVPKPMAAHPSLCNGTYFDLIAFSPLGEMKPYLQVWLGNGRITYKRSVCHQILFTMVSCDQLHVQCVSCWELKCYIVRAGSPCCLECLKHWKDLRICQEIAAQTYLLLKGQILAAEAGCVFLIVNSCRHAYYAILYSTLQYTVGPSHACVIGCFKLQSLRRLV